MPDAPPPDRKTTSSPLEEAAMAAYEDWQRTTFHPSAHPQWTELTPGTKRLWLSAQRAAIQAYLRARGSPYYKPLPFIHEVREVFERCAAELDPPAETAGEQRRG